MTKLIDILVLFSLMCFCACTDYAQKIEDEYGPVKESKNDDPFLNNDVHYKEFTDKRNYRTYKAVQIGDLTWMAENLKYEMSDSWCYNNDKDMCEKYGRLYTWYSAQKACPEGWRLPTIDDWNSLNDAVCGEYGIDLECLEKMLKSKNGWNTYGGANYSGFSAAPAGYFDGKNFLGIGKETAFWSSTKLDEHAYAELLGYGEISDLNVLNKDRAYSVRCVEDGASSVGGTSPDQDRYGEFYDARDGRTYRTINIASQEWMAENLNYNTTRSLCFVYLEENCNSYGRLYGWPLDGVCPDGWHVPAENEWKNLFAYVGDNSGTHLKSSSGWKAGMSGSDDYGFSAMPAGAASYVDMETYRELNNDAKIDVKIKPTAYQNTDRCNEYNGWLNCGDFFVEIVNNESSAFKNLELRFYLGANPALETPVSMGEPQVIFGEQTADANGKYYLPIHIESSIPAGGRIVFQIKWPSATYAEFLDGWSLVQHTGEDAFVEFKGIDLSQAPYFMGDENQQNEVNSLGYEVNSYTLDPYIPVYYNGARIAGYGPDYEPILFFSKGEFAAFWTSSQKVYSDSIYYADLSNESASIVEDASDGFLSVRCVKDR
ncbi:FISUMP domain-containing protein [uncultured Fibrobacter sp.]|uniref:FISUMP domain-containing protein n=1 Tax=uncultured Fibrobacter sp. TaxID=261512 RepID=UPI0025DB71C1|nr:FISUMP domain-containing protein [uncultured Fibrobacter sp.]